MDLRRDLDAFAFLIALGALGAAAVAFVAQRNGAALVMCAICLAGLVLGRLAGVTGAALLVVGLGLTAILWMVWIDPPAGPRVTSSIGHVAGGALAGWALALTMRPRLGPELWRFAALIGVIALTGVWELAELIGDSLLDTGLIPNLRDSAEDVVFGIAGGLCAIVLVGLLPGSRGERADPRADG